MAVPVQETNVKATKFVTTSSRYANSKVLLYDEDHIITFETYKRRATIQSDKDMFYVIPPGEEYRPDLTSYTAFGTVDFWWKIMENNAIYDVFNYKAGLNIRIPSPFNLL